VSESMDEAAEARLSEERDERLKTIEAWKTERLRAVGVEARLREVEAEVRALREALEGINWQAGSNGDAETLRSVLASISRRACAALAGGER